MAHAQVTWRSQDQNLHALMDAAAEEHVAQLQRAEEASVAVRSAPSLPIDLVRRGVFCSSCALVAGPSKASAAVWEWGSASREAQKRTERPAA